ncbi:MFS transporter [Streptomyces sp. WMMC500]|uniref:MFS transporter n=1 Tax=Streptomyces sp. WMMC500 TaxID=3015154 RepID=UPI00248D3A2D|nr:MFS transporter [Streptomyces sp. WMMC500]WBB58211.1 MFS transporter [Streptomyces sp. WMMC500]
MSRPSRKAPPPAPADPAPPGDTAAGPEPGVSARWRAHAAVLAFGTFAVGTDAFVIAGVLPDIADSLGVSVAAAGQLVTVFSLAYAASAPVLGVLTAGWSRRTALVVALAVLTAGNVLTAVAPNYPLVLGARAVAAMGAALYTASATAAAATLAGRRHHGKAIAVVMLGLTSSLVLGTPIGTVIGGAFGWRATLWFLVLAGVAAAVVVAVRLPPLAGAASAGLRVRLTPLTDRRVLAALGRTLLVFTGVYVPYTYLSAVYEPATGGDSGMLAIFLLVFGAAGTAGNLVAGTLADRLGATRVIVVATSLLAAALLTVPVLRGSAVAALPAVVVVGFLSFSITTPQQQEIIALAPAARSVVASLYQSALYLAISLSGIVGGLALAPLGAGPLSPLAAIPVLLTALTTHRAARRSTPGPTANPAAGP